MPLHSGAAWIFAFSILAAALLLLSLGLMRRSRLVTPMCGRCRYPRVGLGATPCPECGCSPQVVRERSRGRLSPAYGWSAGCLVIAAAIIGGLAAASPARLWGWCPTWALVAALPLGDETTWREVSVRAQGGALSTRQLISALRSARMTLEKSAQPEVRLEAIRFAGVAGATLPDESVSVFADVNLTSQSEGVRAVDIVALLARNSPRGVEVLASLVDSDDEMVVFCAASHLRDYPTSPTLMQAYARCMQRPSHFIVSFGLFLCGNCGATPSQQVEVIESALRVQEVSELRALLLSRKELLEKQSEGG